MDKVIQFKGTIYENGYGLIAKTIMTDLELSLGAKGLYSYICAYAGSDGGAFPASERITKELRISKDTFTKHKKELGQTIDTALTIRVVKNAVQLQKTTTPLILHSDLGCQYTSSAFKVYIESTKKITHSFSTNGCPYDNACIESLHASLKKEEVHLVIYFDFDTARLAIFEYIEAWYNRKKKESFQTFGKTEEVTEEKEDVEQQVNEIENDEKQIEVKDSSKIF